MKKKISFSAKYALSEDVVAREVQGELIIVPITSGIGGYQEEVFTLNETGRAIWNKLDGKKNLKDVVDSLSSEFKDSSKEVEKDVLGFMEELLKRKILVEVKKG